MPRVHLMHYSSLRKITQTDRQKYLLKMKEIREKAGLSL